MGIQSFGLTYGEAISQANSPTDWPCTMRVTRPAAALLLVSGLSSRSAAAAPPPIGVIAERDRGGLLRSPAGAVALSGW